MSEPVLYGAAYSVYVRICRLALEEKAQAYRLEEVDVFGPDGAPADHLRRHPFGKIPAFAHDGFMLFETGAIARYIDEAFPAPALQPRDLRSRARMNQAMSILDNYAYPHWVWDVFVERVRRGADGDEARIAAALPKAEICCEALAGILEDKAYLCGAAITLADLYAAPMLACFTMAEEGRAMIAARPRLAAWWERLKTRPSLAASRAITDF
ncbi:MAG TPA: glutathione S-transferase family protein [Ferrovibrio sp.]|uniref:glutathione S-transferase family protein n=1 Tax=Ferrovibrio sp. TaxID=1917215 RepID=UPI002ED688C3